MGKNTLLNERYIRNLGALSEEECLKLRKSSVFIAGCGGLGGYILDMLLRLGVGTIRVADGDRFEPSNLNRQLLSTVQNIAMSKADAAKDYAAKINPDTNLSSFKQYISEDNVREMIRGCDVVLDALDSVKSRRLLKRACDELDIPYIHGAVAGWIAQAGASMPGDGLLDRLYPEENIRSEKSVLSFTPALCAAMQSSLCVRLLCGRAIETGKLYYMDLSELEFTKLF